MFGQSKCDTDFLHLFFAPETDFVQKQVLIQSTKFTE
jgi:hypothetical protein